MSGPGFLDYVDPWVNWTWLSTHVQLFIDATVQHLQLTAIAVAVAFAIGLAMYPHFRYHVRGLFLNPTPAARDVARIRRAQRRLKAARLQLRRIDDLLFVHASRRHGERSCRFVLPVFKMLSTASRPAGSYAEAKERVEKFKALPKRTRDAMNEEATKQGYILPLFRALGWDTSDPAVVSPEEKVSRGRVDYAFRIGNIPLWIVTDLTAGYNVLNLIVKNSETIINGNT